MLVLGLVFATLAAGMAFLITYEEWSRHGLPRGALVRRALGMALVAWVFFLLASAVVGLILGRVLL